MTDYEAIVDYGSFTLTGEPAGAEGLWLLDITEHVRLRDPYTLSSLAL